MSKVLIKQDIVFGDMDFFLRGFAFMDKYVWEKDVETIDPNVPYHISYLNGECDGESVLSEDYKVYDLSTEEYNGLIRIFPEMKYGSFFFPSELYYLKMPIINK